MTTDEWPKGTFVCVEGLKSEAGSKLNGHLGITVGKPTVGDNGGATRLAVFLFAKANDDDITEETSSGLEAILEDAPTNRIKIENLRQLTSKELDDNKVGPTFRESALVHVDNALKQVHENPEQVNSTHLFLSEKCIHMTKKDSGIVDVDATWLLASVVVQFKQGTKDFHALKKDAQRALDILGSLVPLILAGQSATSLSIPNHTLAAHVATLMTHTARYADTVGEKHHYFQQAWECVAKCGDNLNPTDDDFDERRNIAVGALQSFASMAGEYVCKQQPLGDDHVAAMVVKATETSFTLDPENPSNIAGMGNTYEHFAKDYVKAARWYRKALTLPEDVSNTLFSNAHAHWKHKIILVQLRLPGMPLDGARIMHPVGALGSNGQPQTYLCMKNESVTGGPGGMQMMLSLNPPFQYTVPTTDPDDPDVFPPHVLEMVQPPDLLDGGEE